MVDFPKTGHIGFLTQEGTHLFPKPSPSPWPCGHTIPRLTSGMDCTTIIMQQA